jgi:hypothetical protein
MIAIFYRLLLPLLNFSLRKIKSMTMILAVLTLAIYSITPLTTILADSINPGVYSKDSSPFGTPYGQWLAKWWQWSFSIPTANHPRDNYSPEKCGINQAGPVWFLADQLGGREERTCTIPAGKAIFVPLLIGQCDYSTPEIKNDVDLKTCASEGNNYGVIEATIDGVKLKNLEGYRTQAGFFNITVPQNNIYNEKPGTYKAFADGFFVLLEPLKLGTHEVHLKVSVLNPIKKTFNYNADWIYHLNVKT